MKKILVALDNKSLLEQLRKSGKYIVHDFDINNKEDVIEYITKYDVDVLITKDNLAGSLSGRDYVRRIRELNDKLKIILCVDRLDEEYKEVLLGNNVSNIIEGNSITFSELLDMIATNDKKIVIKDNNKKEEIKINRASDINIMSKQKICVFGTSGSGKSYISSLLAQVTSKKLKLNTLLVDMDIQNAATDLYNNLDSRGNNLQYVMEEIDRGSFNSQMLDEIIAREKVKNAKLSFITNNMGIYECQNKISKEYYSKLYDEVDNNYDMVIIDLPASPFLDVVPYSLMKVDKIVFVINPNFISLRQAIKYLDLLTEIWKIDKEKIYVVVNKVKKESLDLRQVKSILRNYNVCLGVKADDKIESVINGLDELFIDNIDEAKVAKIIGLDMLSCKGGRSR